MERPERNNLCPSVWMRNHPPHRPQLCVLGIHELTTLDQSAAFRLFFGPLESRIERFRPHCFEVNDDGPLPSIRMNILSYPKNRTTGGAKPIPVHACTLVAVAGRRWLVLWLFEECAMWAERETPLTRVCVCVATIFGKGVTLPAPPHNPASKDSRALDEKGFYIEPIPYAGQVALITSHHFYPGASYTLLR